MQRFWALIERFLGIYICNCLLIQIFNTVVIYCCSKATDITLSSFLLISIYCVLIDDILNVNVRQTLQLCTPSLTRLAIRIITVSLRLYCTKNKHDSWTADIDCCASCCLSTITAFTIAVYMFHTLTLHTIIWVVIFKTSHHRYTRKPSIL